MRTKGINSGVYKREVIRKYKSVWLQVFYGRAGGKTTSDAIVQMCEAYEKYKQEEEDEEV